jgi:hypothetical protein
LELVPNQLNIKWNIQESKNVIEFTICNKNPGWFGIGLGSFTMMGSNIITITRVNWTIVIEERVASGNSIPLVISNIKDFNDVSISSGCTTAVSFQRALSSIPRGSNGLIYAYSLNSYTIGYHGNKQRGAIPIDLFAFQSFSPMGASFWFKFFHGLSLFTVYIILNPISIFIAAYWRGLSNWVDYHQMIMTVGVTQSLFMVMSMIFALGNHTFRWEAHRVIGIVCSFLQLLNFVIGNSIKVQFWSYFAKFRRTMHKILGYSVMILGCINCFLGLELLTGDNTKFGLIGAVFLVLLLLATFGNYLNSRATTIDKKSGIPKFTGSEFKDKVKQGANWVIIQGYIVDVGEILDLHPGGKLILQKYVGTDVSNRFEPLDTSWIKFQRALRKFFRMPKKELIHKHSRFAYYRMTGLIIARLENEVPTTASKQIDTNE